ncbi:MAG: aspartate--tRNA ligase dps1 [Phylliscum demangeonii]|nr:MAG: aspartate--tRNA ligase dps1 [Phylliscum demangeonii]
MEDRVEAAESERPPTQDGAPAQASQAVDAGTDAAEASAAPSASALKKLAKAKEKEEKKAAKQRELELRQRQQEAGSVDFAKENYGPLPEPRPQAVTILGLEQLTANETTPVTVQARIQNTRAQSAKLAFLLLRQGFATIQAVVAAGEESEQVSRQMVKWVSSVSAESFMEITGVVRAPKDPVASASISGLEIHVKKIYVVSEAIAQFPMQLESALLPELNEDEEDEQEHAAAAADSKTSKIPKVSLKTRLDNRVVDLRTPTNAAITRIKDGVSLLFQEFLRAHGFVQIFTPKLVAAASEGGSNVFAVKYFERTAYLAQSPQLYKQMAIGGDCDRVFEIGPVFRAENSNTHRHMTEFVGLDLEMTFKVHYHEVLDLLEELFVYMFTELKERYAAEIQIVRKQYPVEEFQLPADGRMVRLTFAEGVTLLREAGQAVNDDEDLSTPHERLLGKLVKAKHHTDFFILDQFPLAVRPFYTMPAAHDATRSNSYDFFMRGEEIMSGAQRIHHHALLVQRMTALGISSADDGGLKEYVDAFKYATPPHAGAGIGLERVVFLYLGLGNIRKASMFPRDPQRLRP